MRRDFIPSEIIKRRKDMFAQLIQPYIQNNEINDQWEKEYPIGYKKQRRKRP